MPTINPRLTIPDRELRFETSRSSGPGGQNVNKVESRVTLSFDVSSSPSLAPEQKALIMERLASRISQRGVLRVVSQRHRTQAANRKAVVERFVVLLRDALTVETPRKPTAVPVTEKKHRLEEKRRRARLKLERRQPGHRDD
ncbi:MAG: alternative ribosome rescue aminoacyl-tRNA hydrolase ArfB [Thermoanaerobaculia bacterium]